MDQSISRRERNKQQTRAAILAAARAGFTAKGVEDTTMDDIATAASISRATLFNYFNGKAEILDGLAEDTRHAFAARVEECCRATIDPATRIMLAMSGSGERLEQERRYWGPVVGHSELGWNDATMVPRLDEVVACYERLLGSDLPGATAKETERRLLAEMTVGTYLHQVQRWRFDENFPLKDRLVETASYIGRLIALSGL